MLSLHRRPTRYSPKPNPKSRPSKTLTWPKCLKPWPPPQTTSPGLILPNAPHKSPHIQFLVPNPSHKYAFPNHHQIIDDTIGFVMNTIKPVRSLLYLSISLHLYRLCLTIKTLHLRIQPYLLPFLNASRRLSRGPHQISFPNPNSSQTPVGSTTRPSCSTHATSSHLPIRTLFTQNAPS